MVAHRVNTRDLDSAFPALSTEEVDLCRKAFMMFDKDGVFLIVAKAWCLVYCYQIYGDKKYATDFYFVSTAALVLYSFRKWDD